MSDDWWVRLRRQDPTLVELDLTHGNVNLDDLDLIGRSTTLTTLILGGNRVGDAGAEALAASTSLTSLDLTYNQVGDAGAAGAADALKHNYRLTKLVLRVHGPELRDRIDRLLERNREIANSIKSGRRIKHAGRKRTVLA